MFSSGPQAVYWMLCWVFLFVCLFVYFLPQIPVICCSPRHIFEQCSPLFQSEFWARWKKDGCLYQLCRPTIYVLEQAYIMICDEGLLYSCQNEGSEFYMGTQTSLPSSVAVPGHRGEWTSMSKNAMKRSYHFGIFFLGSVFA